MNRIKRRPFPQNRHFTTFAIFSPCLTLTAPTQQLKTHFPSHFWAQLGEKVSIVMGIAWVVSRWLCAKPAGNWIENMVKWKLLNLRRGAVALQFLLFYSWWGFKTLLECVKLRIFEVTEGSGYFNESWRYKVGGSVNFSVKLFLLISRFLCLFEDK